MATVYKQIPPLLPSLLDVTSDITPAAENTYSLGSFGHAWKDIYGHRFLVGNTAGIAVIDNGTVLVETPAVTAGSMIFLAKQDNGGGTPGNLRVSGRVAGESFTITSTSASEDGNIAWWIVEPIA